nr:hypothetical protein [uncultured Draconibacterium sp.]
MEINSKNVLDIPFNKFIDWQKTDKASGFFLQLDEKEQYLNHLNNFHSSLLFALVDLTQMSIK